MTIDVNEWFVDLPFTGARTWDQQADRVYYSNAGALSPAAVRSAVDTYARNGTHVTDSVPTTG